VPASSHSKFTARSQTCFVQSCAYPVLLPQILNFSIAYGKTAHGLSKDFGVTLEEAQETVRRWYSDRWVLPRGSGGIKGSGG
jgi:hypothetical protein